MIKITANPDKNLWQQFVNNHPKGNIFQAPIMAEVYRNTKNYQPVILAAIESETNDISALVQAVIIKEFTGILDQFTARSVITGGPLYRDSDTGNNAAVQLMEYYDRTVGSQVIYTEIRNLWDLNNTALLPGYVFEEHLNYLVDLTSGKEKLWTNLSKARKYGVNKSRKAGVIVEELKTLKERDILYDLLSDTYKKARLPLADKSLFCALCQSPGDKHHAKVFFARHNGEYIGAIILLMHNGTIYDWYACSRKDASNVYPNDLLVWHAFEWGCDNHYSVFDFMGAGKPNEAYGVRDFKKQFGGELVQYGRYKKIHAPAKMWLSQQGFSIYRRFMR